MMPVAVSPTSKASTEIWEQAARRMRCCMRKSTSSFVLSELENGSGGAATGIAKLYPSHPCQQDHSERRPSSRHTPPTRGESSGRNEGCRGRCRGPLDARSGPRHFDTTAAPAGERNPATGQVTAWRPSSAVCTHHPGPKGPSSILFLVGPADDGTECGEGRGAPRGRTSGCPFQPGPANAILDRS